MLCLPALNQSEFSGSPMAAAAAASIRAQHCGYLASASTSTPTPTAASTTYINNNNNNNNSYNSTPSSSSLYSLPLPPQLQNLDSFSLPSSSTPCSMPGAPSWQAQAAAPNSSNTIAPLTNTNTTTPKQPLILDSLTASKISIVENLVDTAALIIESIWPSPVGATCSAKTPVIPLHIFVKETLRRSRTTLSTLQLALYYIYKIRNQVLAAQEKIRQEHHHRQRQSQPLSPNGSFDNFSDEEGRQQRDYFHSMSAAHTKVQIQKNSLPLTPPVVNHTPTALSPLSLSSSTSTSPILAKSEPVGCGRRMFLAALILASKFQQDRTYSNKAWSKISGLPVAEINLNEITFLTLIDYRLFVSQAVFQKWVTILTEKGKVRDRAASVRTCNTFSSDVAVQQPTRRNSIQYCNNTLPARMTCVTASSLEHQHQPSTPTATVAPHLPSFALFVAEQQRTLQSTPTCEKPSFQFEMAIPLSAPVLTKQALDAHSAATVVSGLVQPESAPRQQQGMGASMTLRWVQDQRREFIRSRLLSMGYTTSLQQQQQTTESPSQVHLSQRSILENFQNNVIMYSESGTYSLNMHRQQQQQQQMKVDTKVGRDQTFLPSPTSSGSPSQLTGAKRRMTDSDESEEMKDQRSNARRRLSVSFLVDC